VGVHALGGQDRRGRVGAGGRDDQGAAREGVGTPVECDETGRGGCRDGRGADRGGAAAQPGHLFGEPLGAGVQVGGRGERADLVGDGEQGREVTGELDVQLLLARPVRKVGGGVSAIVWTDFVRIGSYMGMASCA
jgi:hypothetical protein